MSNRILIKRATLSKLLQNYSKEMKLLTIGGRLTKKDGWWNVVEHCQEQLVFADGLTDLLGLRSREKEKVMQISLCHDWDKRIEVKPSDFSQRDIRRAAKLFRRVSPSTNLMFATKPHFVAYALVERKSSLVQRLVYYIDTSTKEAEFVGYSVRLRELKGRNPHPYSDPELTKKLGGKFWEKAVELAQNVEKEIIESLKKRGFQLKPRTSLPDLVYDYLHTKYVSTK